MFDTSRSIIQKINLPLLSKHKVELYMKRDDFIHADVSGNKWRKLKYNVLKAKESKQDGILTFGGAFSNHLLATASACKQLGLKSVGIVRGEELNIHSNETLLDCAQMGMELKFISRQDYRRKSDKDFLQELRTEFPNYFIVPEGGANYLGIIGCQEILQNVNDEFSDIVVCQGTATTSCGILLSLKENQRLHVFPAMKGYDSIGEMRNLMLTACFEGELMDELLKAVFPQELYSFGGYGKYTQDLIDFLQGFYTETGVRLDPIYTGKAMYGMMDLIQKNTLNNSKILFIHTGGLQGIRGVEKKIGYKIYD